MNRKYRKKPKGFSLLLIFSIIMIGALSLQNKEELFPFKTFTDKNFTIGKSDFFDTSLIVGEVIHILRVPLLLVILLLIGYAGYKSIRKLLWRKKIRMSRIYEIDRMSGSQFEKYLDVYFSDMGYKVESKGGSGDKGADLILTNKNGKRIVVQAKRYGKMERGKFIGGNVPYEAVQQAHTAKDLYKCNEALIITNNKGFTRQAQETAAQLNIELWDRTKLIEFMAAYKKIILEEESHDMMFRVYDHNGRGFTGMIYSPDNSVKANDYRGVVEIMKQYGVISIAGLDEMILPAISVKGWIFYQPI